MRPALRPPRLTYARRLPRTLTLTLTLTLSLTLALHLTLAVTLTLGGLTAFFAYSDTFAAGCSQAQEVLEQAFALRSACARYFALLDRAPSMRWEGGAAPREGGFRGALRRANPNPNANANPTPNPIPNPNPQTRTLALALTLT